MYQLRLTTLELYDGVNYRHKPYYIKTASRQQHIKISWSGLLQCSRLSFNTQNSILQRVFIMGRAYLLAQALVIFQGPERALRRAALLVKLRVALVNVDCPE